MSVMRMPWTREAARCRFTQKPRRVVITRAESMQFPRTWQRARIAESGTQRLAAIARAACATRLARGRIAEIPEDFPAEAAGGRRIRDRPAQLRVLERFSLFCADARQD